MPTKITLLTKVQNQVTPIPAFGFDTGAASKLQKHSKTGQRLRIARETTESNEQVIAHSKQLFGTGMLGKIKQLDAWLFKRNKEREACASLVNALEVKLTTIQESDQQGDGARRSALLAAFAALREDSAGRRSLDGAKLAAVFAAFDDCLNAKPPSVEGAGGLSTMTGAARRTPGRSGGDSGRTAGPRLEPASLKKGWGILALHSPDASTKPVDAAERPSEEAQGIQNAAATLRKEALPPPYPFSVLKMPSQGPGTVAKQPSESNQENAEDGSPLDSRQGTKVPLDVASLRKWLAGPEVTFKRAHVKDHTSDRSDGSGIGASDSGAG